MSYTFRAISVRRTRLDQFADDSGVHTFPLLAGNFAGVVTATEIVGCQTFSFFNIQGKVVLGIPLMDFVVKVGVRDPQHVLEKILVQKISKFFDDFFLRNFSEFSEFSKISSSFFSSKFFRIFRIFKNFKFEKNRWLF